MKSIKLFIILFLFLFVLTGCANNADNFIVTNISRLSTEQNAINKTNIATNTTPNTVIIPSTISPEEELKSFTTKYNESVASRVHNMTLVCEKLNNHIVAPNTEFSFLNTVGSLNAENGYQEADVIVNKKKVKGFGGGACQVSTTLFNAVDGLDGIEILERHEHGKDVYYVPDGRDAAISHGSGFDFRFKNNNNYSLKIVATLANGEIKMVIMKI